MERTRHFATLLLLFATAVFTLSSCTDDDMDQAYNLNGYWQGTVYGDYYSNRYHSSDTWDTEIWFVQNGVFSNGGYGREIDYDRYGRSYSSDFNWKVINGRIYMEFDDGYRIIIRDYELYSIGSGQRFRGIFESWDTGRQLATFNLIKTSGWRSMAKEHAMEVQPQDNDNPKAQDKGDKQ